MISMQISTASLYKTDGTTPLKYRVFLAAASGDHQTAFQNAINALYASSGAYNKHLDLEGATVMLASPVTAPTGSGSNTRSIVNGEIRAATGFSGGDYMLNIMGDISSHDLHLVNLTMNGQTLASWIKWDIGNLIIEASKFKNPKPGDSVSTIPPGLLCADGGVGSNADAGFWIDNCWFSADDATVSSSDRMTIGITSQTGDNKIGGGTTMSYFRHCLIFESFACIIDGLHVFQGGAKSGMTDHTASIKFTNGRSGSIVNGLYLGKSFMELSNETRTAADHIGEIAITNMRAFMDNAQRGAAHIVARNYAASGTTTVQDISVVNSLFVNGGSVHTNATKLFNPSQFDRTGYKGITFAGNIFETPDVQSQANPCTLKKTFSSSASHTFDFMGYMPFAGRPRELISAVGKPTSGGAQALAEGSISGNTVEVISPRAWAGDIVATVSCNNSQSSGFLDG
jgi:hypothetical protein